MNMNHILNLGTSATCGRNMKHEKKQQPVVMMLLDELFASKIGPAQKQGHATLVIDASCSQMQRCYG